jgi:hypothetical protein
VNTFFTILIVAGLITSIIVIGKRIYPNGSGNEGFPLWVTNLPNIVLIMMSIVFFIFGIIAMWMSGQMLFSVDTPWEKLGMALAGIASGLLISVYGVSFLGSALLKQESETKKQILSEEKHNHPTINSLYGRLFYFCFLYLLALSVSAYMLYILFISSTSISSIIFDLFSGQGDRGIGMTNLFHSIWISLAGILDWVLLRYYLNRAVNLNRAIKNPENFNIEKINQSVHMVMTMIWVVIFAILIAVN